MRKGRRTARSAYPGDAALNGKSGAEREALKRQAAGSVRVVTADRKQLRLLPQDLDQLIGSDHTARAIWDVLEKVDLSAFHAVIDAREQTPGRPRIDPRILITLWLYAINQGVSSAREIERLTQAHDAYRWICGGVNVNHHTLSDFYVSYEQGVAELFSNVLGLLWFTGLVSMQVVAQDGMRVRASAGSGSYRRAKSLGESVEQARAHLKEVTGGDPGEQSKRRQAAEQRAARERLERLERAQEELNKLIKERAGWVPSEQKRAGEARVSTTDPEARKLHMADGGTRPAYNVQWATDTDNRIIVGVGVTSGTNDAGQLEPMWADLHRRTAMVPAQYLVDGGFVSKENIKSAAAAGIDLYAPAPRHKGVEDVYAPRADDPEELAQWRARMASEAGKQIYKKRASTSEWVNADSRAWRGFDGFRVRGLKKVLSAALWMATAHNVLRWVALSKLI